MFKKIVIRLICLLPILFAVLTAFCQENKQQFFDLKKQLPTSPEAAMLGRFGDVPISAYTGTAGVSVPLYTVKVDDFEVPIVLRYHGSGIKVEDQASNVGLGWNLEPGGAIIQIVNGRQDSYDQLISSSPEGYAYLKAGAANSVYNERPEHGLDWPCFLHPEDSDDETTLGQLRIGDGQPDIYQYNFLDYSGKFFIHPETGKVVLMDKKEELSFEKSGGNDWIATTLDGNKFYFQALESATTSYEMGYTSFTFKLTRIILNNGRKIDFEYQNGYYQWFIYNESYNSGYPFGFGGAQVEPYWDYTHQYTKNITRIATDDIIVEFNWEDRQDLLGRPDGDSISTNGSLSVKRIKSVDIKDAVSGKQLKSFRLAYDYFPYTTVGGTHTPISGNTTQDILGKRLKLLSVQEVGYRESGEEIINPEYRFDYNESVVLPLKTSFARDFWGYYNGKNNSRLIPDLSFFYYSGFPEYQNMPAYLLHAVQGGIRTPDTSKMSACLLKRITYPTGGYTEFDYEPNDFANYNYPDMDKILSSEQTVVVEDKNSSTGSVASVPFSLPRAMPIRFTHTVNKGANQALTFEALLPSTITLLKKMGSSVSVLKTWQMLDNQQYRDDLATDGFVQWVEDYYFPYESGAQYIVTTSLPDNLGPQNTSTISAAVQSSFKYYSQTDFKTSYGGGVRIAQLRNYTGPGVIASKKAFSYHNEDGSSSGILMSPLKFLNEQEMYFVKFWGWSGGDNPTGASEPIITSSLLNIWFISSESFVPYSNAAGGNLIGYSRVEESEVDEEGETNGKRVQWFHNMESETKVNNPDNPRLLNGLAKKEELFSDAGEKLSETNFYYTILSQSSFAGVKLLSRFVGSEPCEVSGAFVDGGNIWNGQKRHRINFYPIKSEWHRLQKKETKQFTPAGIITTSEDYEYNSKGQIGKINSLNSKAEKTTQQFIYPGDVSTTVPGSVEPKMVEVGLFNYLLEQRTLLNDVEIAKVKLTYREDTWGIVKDRIQRSHKGGPFFTDVYFGGYGKYHKPYGITQKETPLALLWSDDNIRPVAEVKNAFFFEIAYTSFENNKPFTKGYWQFSGSIVDDATAPTGKKCYDLASGSITSFNPLRQKEYVVSYWSKNNSASYLVNATSGAKGGTINGWSYYEHKINVPENGSVTVSGSDYIDELRLYPAGAQMTTYTYEPLVGITSQCDINNRITFYEYDGLGRLIHIRDEDQNILKKFCYNYQGQQENCAVYHSRAQSGTFTKNNCGTGATGSAVTYAVAADAYTSAISQEDADRQAQNDVNANGQAYANTNGVCTWVNDQKSGVFTRNNCPSGYTGSNVTYTVNKGVYTSTVSLADANQKAQNDINANGQNYANTNGVCTPTYTFTPYYGWSSAYSSFALTGTGSVNFLFAVIKNGSQVSTGVSYQVATLSGSAFLPSGSRTVNASEGGRTWQVTFVPNGYIYIKLLSGIAPTYISLSGTYSL